MASQPITLAQALVPPTLAQIQAQLFSTLQAQGLPVTDWAVGGVARTLTLADAQALFALLTEALPNLVSGGFTTLAASTTPGFDNPWLDLLAQNFYNLTRNPAVTAVGTMTLSTVASGAGPYTIAVGALQIADTVTGQVYTNLTGGTLNASSTLSIQVQAVAPGAAANIPNGATLVLLTPYPGVVATNPTVNFSPVSAVVNTGGGTIVVSTSGVPAQTQVVIKITQTGPAATMKFAYSTTDTLGGDGSFSPAQTTTFSGGQYIYNVHQVQSGVVQVVDYFHKLTFTGMFNQGDYFVYQSPGSWLAAQSGDQTGADAESDPELLLRCQDKWSTVGTAATSASFQTWALEAVPGAVTFATVLTDPVIAGQVDVILEGPAGSVSTATVAATQQFIAQRAPITAKVLVSSVVTLAITTMTGTVFYRGNKATVQAAVASNVETYVQGVLAGGVIYFNEIIRQILDAPGAVNTQITDLNGGGTADIQLASNQIATIATSVITALTWSQVP